MYDASGQIRKWVNRKQFKINNIAGLGPLVLGLWPWVFGLGGLWSWVFGLGSLVLGRWSWVFGLGS